MTCVRVGGVLAVPGVWILSGARRRAVSCMTLKPLECRLQVAFGVDQEVGGDHDLFAFGDPVEHFDAIAATATQGDVARCEPAGAGLDQHHLARAAVEHGRARNGQDRSSTRLLQHHRPVEPRPEVAVGVGQGDAHIHGARHRIDDGLHEGDLALGHLARQGHGFKAGRLAGLDTRGLRRRDLRDHPHRRQVRQAQDGFAGLEACALDHRLLDHDRVRGRGEHQTRLAQLRVADFPVAQAGACGIAQAGHRCRARGIGPGQPAGGLVGQPVFLLRRRQLWAVDGEQRLPGADAHAGLVRVQPLHPAFKAGRDRVLPGLVDLDRAAGAHGSGQGSALDRFGAHAQRLHLVGWHHHRSRRRGRRVAGVDRNVVHAHRVLLRHRRGVRKAHGIAVIEHLAFRGRRFGGRGCGGRTVRGAARHPADGEGGECNADGERQGLDTGHRISPSMARTAAAPNSSSRSASTRARSAPCHSLSASSSVPKSTSPTW